MANRTRIEGGDELFPASPGAQLKEITVSTFSIRAGIVVRIIRSWIEKVLTVISYNWTPGEGGNSSQGPRGRSWRTLRLILRRGRPISNFWGATASCEGTYLVVLNTFFFFKYLTKCFEVLTAVPTNPTAEII